MATDNVSIGTAWVKVVDSSVETFALSSVEKVPWEVALGTVAPTASIYGHKVLDSDRQVTRLLGDGHVYARVPDGTATLVRTL